MNCLKKISLKFTRFLNRDIGIVEWILYGIVSLFMFLFFQHGDIVGTAETSFLLLDGNISDFYEAAAEFSNGYITTNYLLPTFILFAFWNIPLKILGKQPLVWGESGFFRIMWYKMLPTICFLLSAYFFYKILEECGFNKKTSKVGLFLYLSMPFAMFSQYMFGQYDSFTLLFMTLGLYYYFKGLNRENKYDWFRFVLFMAIGMTFKTLLFAFFLPLILLREKRVSRLIYSLIIFVFPYILLKIPFRSSIVFEEGVNNFNAADFVKRVTLSNGTESIQLLPILFAVFCAYLFFVNVKEKEKLINWTVYSGCMVCVMLFGIMHWHPQWLIITVAFFTLGTLLSQRYDVFLLLDIIATFFYMAYVMNADWVDKVNTWLATGGILGAQLLGYTPEVFPGDYFPVDSPSQAFSFLAAIIFVYGLFHHPKYLVEKVECQNIKQIYLVRLRFIICSFILLYPMVGSIWSSFNSSRVIRITTSTTYSNSTPITNDSGIEQIITAPYDMNCDTMSCRLGIPSSADTGFLLEIYECETGNKISESYYKRNELSTEMFLSFPEVNLEEGKQYSFYFSSGAEVENSVSLIGTRDFKNVAEAPDHAVLQGEAQNFNYALVLYESGYKIEEKK